MDVKIPICGPPIVGKTTILEHLAELLKVDNVTCRRGQDISPCLSFHYSYLNHNVEFLTFGGSIVYRERCFIDLLRDASLVVMVASAKPNWRKIDQRDYVHDLISASKAVSRRIEDIPWIPVLNQTDLGSDNPISDMFPAGFWDHALQLVAARGSGIDSLWREIALTLGTRVLPTL